MQFPVTFRSTNMSFKLEFQSFVAPYQESYSGEYTVVPKFVPQALHTKNYIMHEDVQVREIPVTVTANTAGGNTIVIGG